MRAVRFDRFGPPSVLQLVDIPRPAPAAGEAVVEIRAAAINPSDVKNVAGRMSQTKPPRTPGRDYAGVVVDGPREWQGVAVWGTGGDLGFARDGTHAEAIVVPVESLRRKPERLTFAEAAAVGTPFVTAYLGLTRASATKADVVMVAGAAGSVGGAAVQIATWSGATVIGLVRDDAQAAVARSLGARTVIIQRDSDPTATMKALLGATTVDIAFDTTGILLDASVQVLRHAGRVVAITAPADGKVTFNLRELYRRDARIIGVDSMTLTALDAAAILEELAAGFEAGALAARPVTERPLDDAVAAYQEKAGKIVLVPRLSEGSIT
ncbi:MAG: quinone oxidoreductase [Myxococcales bacterium]|nr:quinone oxidoreductase [Myxococcales bacterium]